MTYASPTEQLVAKLYRAVEGEAELQALENLLVRAGLRQRCDRCGWVGTPTEAPCGVHHRLKVKPPAKAPPFWTGSAREARALMMRLFDLCVWLQVDPLPDGLYSLTVKPDARRFLP